MLDRRHFLAGTAASALAACAGRGDRPAAAVPVTTTPPPPASPPPPPPMPELARQLYTRLFEARLRYSPENATSLGLDTGANADLRSQLSPSTPDHRIGGQQVLLDYRAAMQNLDRDALSGRDRGWLDTARWLSDRAVTAATFDFGVMGGYPEPYVLSQLTGSYQEVPDFLDSVHPVATASDAEAYLSRLEQFARNVDQEVANSRADAGRGVIPPTYIIEKTLTQTRALARERGASAGLVTALVRKTAARQIAGDWEARAVRIVDGPLALAVARQEAWLTELAPRSDRNPAARRLPNGEAFYQHCLRQHTSTSLTPDEAHAEGLRQVAELTAQADPLLRAQGLTRGTVGARIAQMGRDQRYLYPNTDAGREQVLTYVRRLMDIARARMPDAFYTLPTTGMEVRRVPPNIEVGAPRGYAQGGSLDGSRPGAYYINLRDTTTWPRWTLPTLTYHEGIPGHLWQGATAIGAQNIPLFHRRAGIAAYGEGWGLYAEQLADEIGLYAEDPVGKIGLLQSFLYRAARIVMDTGMHWLGWSRERAIRYFMDTVGLDEASCTSEVERYIVWPGQACAYKIGHTQIVRAREAARARLGGRFDLKAFHDLILLSGSMPLEVLTGMTQEWDGSRVR